MDSIRGVILDVDGTLVDSNDAHARAWVDALAEHGLAVPFEKVRPLIGKGGDKLLPQVSGIEEDTPEGQRISDRRKEIFQEKYLANLKPCRGARELLLHLQRQGLKLVVASSARGEELQGLLKAAGCDDLLRQRTSSDDAEESKPDPDIVQAALERVGLPAGQMLMIGDTPYDVEAAARAGVPVIALRCGGWDDDGLAGAAAVYDDPADLLEHIEASPLGRGAAAAR